VEFRIVHQEAESRHAPTLALGHQQDTSKTLTKWVTQPFRQSAILLLPRRTEVLLKNVLRLPDRVLVDRKNIVMDTSDAKHGIYEIAIVAHWMQASVQLVCIRSA